MSYKNCVVICLLLTTLLAVGCTPVTDTGFNKEPELPLMTISIADITCDTLEEGRQRVMSAYQQSIENNSTVYVEKIRALQDMLQDCLRPIRQGGPCDDPRNALQDAYATASIEPSNDETYYAYKVAQKKRQECHDSFEERYKERETKNKGKEKECNDAFQSQRNAAEVRFYEIKNSLTEKRDELLAQLDALEEKCKEPVAATGGGEHDEEIGVLPGSEGGADTNEAVTPPNPDAAVCQGGTSVVSEPTIPGANGTPRPAKAKEKGMKEVLVDLMITVAEDIGKTPVPISAINDQIFAGIVCVKIRSRIAEMIIEESDAQLSNDRPTEIRIRKKIQDYNRAMHVRCAIAEGRPPLEIKEEVQVLKEEATFGACESDADCGEPICCSETTRGYRTCDAENGTCIANKEPCSEGFVCTGTPAACKRQLEVIVYQGKYIPIDQVHKFRGDDPEECDTEEHRHANVGSAKATDGTILPDASVCGYGKTKDVPVKKVFVE